MRCIFCYDCILNLKSHNSPICTFFTSDFSAAKVEGRCLLHILNGQLLPLLIWTDLFLANIFLCCIGCLVCIFYCFLLETCWLFSFWVSLAENNINICKFWSWGSMQPGITLFWASLLDHVYEEKRYHRHVLLLNNGDDKQSLYT